MTIPPGWLKQQKELRRRNTLRQAARDSPKRWWGWRDDSENTDTSEDDETTTMLEGRQTAVIVVEVVSGSPAEQGGLQSQDLVVSIDDRPVTNNRDIFDCMASKPVGKPLKMKVIEEAGAGKMKVL
eukprot:CAMPEP_0113949996 /NCGR_PEP_ID=MMETSP1339-20121228/78636_1 /TAXON_ID=94617 /ORGANISM="Fibrocapsa japonica" /LENGTH=125 /DNA_ID=CAMNT_0000957661 /DNA_START=23 /DNA_END=397 /DNA_ORIENTATION=+ /assembly_acc=CAM_ASM_000762